MVTKYCDGCGLPEHVCCCEPFEYGYTELQDSCPSCGAMWGFEEIQYCQCSACGYPANEDDAPDVDYDYEKELFFFQPGGDVCPHCGSDNTERIDTYSDDPVIWVCQCGSCAEMFHVLVEPEVTDAED